MTTEIFIPVARDRIRLLPQCTKSGEYKVPGRPEHTITWTDPAGRRYVWQGLGTKPGRFIPAQGSFDSVPELLPADWKADINVSVPETVLYDIAGPGESVFEIFYAYPHVVCPHCQTMHLASSWGVDAESEDTVYLCPDCRNWRDVELVREVLPREVLWTCCQENMIRWQREVLDQWSRDFARLYSVKFSGPPCANA